MAYDETLAIRIDKALSGVSNVEQKKMFGGAAFMVKNICVLGWLKICLWHVLAQSNTQIV